MNPLLRRLVTLAAVTVVCSLGGIRPAFAHTDLVGGAPGAGDVVAGAPADLTLTLAEESPWELFQAALRGDKPPVRIVGDVQFAAEINWLVDHVRWDLEEDLSRIVGDAPAHALGEAGRRMVEALRGFVRPAGGSASQPAPTPAPGAGT